MARWFLGRNGLVTRNGRIIAKVPALLARPIVWLYWDVWWPSWLSWRLTCNPNLFRLATTVTMAAAIFATRHR